MNPVIHILAAGVLTTVLIPLYMDAVRWLGRVQAPEERSMHAEPLPVGAGIIPIPLALGLWVVSLETLSFQQLSLVLACAGLVMVSWIDDLRGLPASLRLIAQSVVVTWCLYQLPTEARAVSWLPLGLERGLEALAWLWFINLFNFMDGIDGLAASEAVSTSLGYAALMVLVVGFRPDLLLLALLISAAMIGYLVWNWHPARVLMGDAGSIPLGFLIGWLMLDLSLRGHATAAVILPLYFLVDSTLTLLKRLLRGRAPHEPHREHYYQQAALTCGNHARVVMRVVLANVALLTLAVLSVFAPGTAVLAAFGVVWLLIARLQRVAKPH